MFAMVAVAVIPAKAGIPFGASRTKKSLDSRLRGHDKTL
jgi:hypothetical protein